jgi:hypothetical protein
MRSKVANKNAGNCLNSYYALSLVFISIKIEALRRFGRGGHTVCLLLGVQEGKRRGVCSLRPPLAHAPTNSALVHKSRQLSPFGKVLQSRWAHWLLMHFVSSFEPHLFRPSCKRTPSCFEVFVGSDDASMASSAFVRLAGGAYASVHLTKPAVLDTLPSPFYESTSVLWFLSFFCQLALIIRPQGQSC